MAFLQIEDKQWALQASLIYWALLSCLDTMEFSLNGAKLSLNSGNSENLRNHWGMNWVQYKDLLCCLWPCGWVVESLSLTQEILGSNPAIFLFDFNYFRVKAFRENSNNITAMSQNSHLSDEKLYSIYLKLF